MAESNCYAKGVYGFNSATGPSDIMNVEVFSPTSSQDAAFINEMLQPNNGTSICLHLYTAPIICALRKCASLYHLDQILLPQ
jgi:hypothetical protein